MALFSKEDPDAGIGRVYEEQIKASKSQARSAYLVVAQFRAGWLDAKAGEIVHLTPEQAVVLERWVKPVAEPARKSHPETAAKPSADPPGAPPIITGQVSSQVRAGGRGRRKTGKV